MPDDGSLKYRALLEISEALVARQECGALFGSLWASLHKLIPFDFLVLILQTGGKEPDRMQDGNRRGRRD